ncbi:MAG: ABC transporter permease, partial [Synergistaceae bacterium]|nr:ABC transporter permease [Synergistaceae bacterium]
MLKKFIDAAGWPRIIIGLFLFSLYAGAPFVGVSVATSLSNTLERFGMNGIMVLAMVPMVQTGCGLNFGLPLGIIAGLLGATLSLEFSGTVIAAMSALRLDSVASFGIFGTAICIAVPIAAIL